MVWFGTVPRIWKHPVLYQPSHSGCQHNNNDTDEPGIFLFNAGITTWGICDFNILVPGLKGMQGWLGLTQYGILN